MVSEVKSRHRKDTYSIVMLAIAATSLDEAVEVSLLLEHLPLDAILFLVYLNEFDL